MKRIGEEKFDDDLAGANLAGEAAQAGLVLIGRSPHHKLVAKFLDEFFSQPRRYGIIIAVSVRAYPEKRVHLVFGKLLHAHQKAQAEERPAIIPRHCPRFPRNRSDAE